VIDPALFARGETSRMARHDAAPDSNGGKEKLGGVSKRGDKYIRRLLVGGAIEVIRHARTRATPEGKWVRATLARKPAKIVALALANKTARKAWAIMKRGEALRPKGEIRRARGLKRPS
jgi:transposase